jgi:hypothetical protein
LGADSKRLVEVRLIVIVLVDLSASSLPEALTSRDGVPKSLADVLASEVASNLESVSYVETAIVSPV